MRWLKSRVFLYRSLRGGKEGGGKYQRTAEAWKGLNIGKSSEKQRKRSIKDYTKSRKKKKSGEGSFWGDLTVHAAREGVYGRGWKFLGGNRFHKREERR